MLDGADVSGATARSLIIPEIEAEGFTRIHAVNPNLSAAAVTLELVDRNGAVKASAVLNVAPQGAAIELLRALFPTVVPDVSDYVRITADQAVTAQVVR